MANIKNVVGKYMGKQMVDEKPNYTRWKVQFEVEGKVWNFGMFMPWTKKDGSNKQGENPNDMKEGQMYKVGFTEFLTEGREHASKTAISFFQVKKEDSNKTIPMQSYGQQTARIVEVKAENTQKLIDTYFQLMKAEKINENHFVGTIVRSLYENDLQPLVDEYNKIRGIKPKQKEEEEKEEDKK